MADMSTQHFPQAFVASLADEVDIHFPERG